MTLGQMTSCVQSGAIQPILAPLYLHDLQDAYRSGISPIFRDPIVRSLLSLPPLKRLADIGFLGAMDFLRHGSGRAGHRRRHNRLEHSISVACLADIYAREARLPDDRRRLLLCAALLHDVGHGPLSHTLEPVFSEAFGLDHHIVTRQIVTGERPVGEGISEALIGAGVDIEEVLALISGEHDGDVGFLFSGAINLDTLDGINRCRAFVAPRPGYGTPESTVRRWAHDIKIPEADFDAFWSLKDEVYQLFIGAPIGASLDAVAQIYMRTNIARFSPEDFFVTESVLRRRHPKLYEYLDIASRSPKSIGTKIPSDWKKQAVNLKNRSFFIDADTQLIDYTSINKRYRQIKSIERMTLADLLD